MAVYTEVGDDDLEAFAGEYDLGSILSCKGIAEGVENTNYLIHTSTGSYILTLYEKRVAEADLPFFLGLMDHLAGKGIPCPTPVHGKDGSALRRLCGRPAAIITFLEGMWRKPLKRNWVSWRQTGRPDYPPASATPIFSPTMCFSSVTSCRD